MSESPYDGNRALEMMFYWVGVVIFGAVSVYSLIAHNRLPSSTMVNAFLISTSLFILTILQMGRRSRDEGVVTSETRKSKYLWRIVIVAASGAVPAGLMYFISHDIQMGKYMMICLVIELLASVLLWREPVKQTPVTR